jgi:hypothetical protein
LSSQNKKSFSDYDNNQTPNEVLGMISKHRELLMFSKPVQYDQRDISNTLSNVETSMQ